MFSFEELSYRCYSSYVYKICEIQYISYLFANEAAS